MAPRFSEQFPSSISLRIWEWGPNIIADIILLIDLKLNAIIKVSYKNDVPNKCLQHVEVFSFQHESNFFNRSQNTVRGEISANKRTSLYRINNLNRLSSICSLISKFTSKAVCHVSKSLGGLFINTSRDSYNI